MYKKSRTSVISRRKLSHRYACVSRIFLMKCFHTRDKATTNTTEPIPQYIVRYCNFNVIVDAFICIS